MKVVVIGAGLSGLAAACRLVGSGHEVTVLERDPDVGGRAGRLVRAGFTFDTGPVVMTMPDLLDDTLRAAGADPGDLLTMRRLDPGYRTVHPDGSVIDVPADPAALRAEVERTCGPAEAARLDRFLPWLEALHEAEFDHFIDTDYDSVLDLVRSPRRAADLLRLGAFGSLDAAVGRHLHDERLRKVFTFQALYAGVSPQQARALLAVIAYMDCVRGVWFPDGGMHAIPRALARAFTDAGGRLHTGVTVTDLLRRTDGAIAGVATADGDRLAADAVVCTLDLPVAYRRLLPDLRAPRAARRGIHSPSAVVWHLGVRGAPDDRARHHTIHFGADWSGAFDALTRRGTLMPDPSRLVTAPTLTEPGLAPPGHSALYVLEPVPNLTAPRLDWAREAGPMRERLLAFLDRGGYPTDIVTEEFVTPLDWQAAGLHAGTPFALAHTFGQSGPFRPANTDPRVPGLVFAGSGTTPGVGIPMVLVSGRLAAGRVDQYAGVTR